MDFLLVTVVVTVAMILSRLVLRLKHMMKKRSGLRPFHRLSNLVSLFHLFTIIVALKAVEIAWESVGSSSSRSSMLRASF